jgi:hypothetical protein
MIKSRMVRWEGHVARMVENRNAYRPLGSPTRAWVDNVKTNLREIGWGGMDWINLAQGMDQ